VTPLAEQTWTNRRTGAWVKASSVGDNMVMERVIKPGTGKADAHLHLDYVESFEIIDGTATIEVDGRAINAGPGERVEVARGVAHRNPYNDTEGDLQLRHTVAPGGDFAKAFVTSLGHHMKRDTVNDQGEFSDLQLFVVLRGTRAQSYRAGIPVAVQKPVIALGALLGRLRGYKAGYP
jgi:mannose-6-phosphate isomerase-like protein (cupin superfamily)